MVPVPKIKPKSAAPAACLTLISQEQILIDLPVVTEVGAPFMKTVCVPVGPAVMMRVVAVVGDPALSNAVRVHPSEFDAMFCCACTVGIGRITVKLASIKSRHREVIDFRIAAAG